VSLITDFFTYPFLTQALFSGLFLALLCGLLSPIIVTKKFAFMGASISHGALLGVAIGLSFFEISSTQGSFFLFVITLIITLLAVAPLALATFRQRLPSDALIGLFFTATMGTGLLIHQASGSKKGDLLSYLFGNILTLTTFDLILLGILCAIVLPLFWLKRPHWILFLFDEEAAAVQGMPTRHYHYILFFALTLVIVAGLKISGVILINSYLLIPGIFALRTAPNARSTFAYSIVFALKATVLGLFLANALDWPVGATLAVVQVLLFFISLTFQKAIP
jgi:ABC-type Mn2+/Zn2+ transport system permease subunit